MAEIKKSLLLTLDFPPDLGGVAAYYQNVCQNLPPAKILVLAPAQAGDSTFDRRRQFAVIRHPLLTALARPARGKFKIFAKTAKRLKLLRLYFALKPILKNHRIELLQIGQILPLGTLALLLKKYQKLPFIVYSHGLDITLPQNSSRKKYLLKKIITGARNIIANSYFTKDELVKLGADPKKVAAVHPGPNLSAEQAAEQKIEEIKNRLALKNKKILITVGRLQSRKGHDLVLKALPQIIRSVPNLVYLIIGQGPELKNLQTYAVNNGLSGQIRFLDSVSNAELGAYYQLADVFIMPARRLKNGDVEGFGIAYLEANLFGKPVIGGKSGGVPEAIINGQTGLLVNPTDVGDIAQAAIKLLTDETLAHRLGIQGLERVHRDFDWADQVDKIKEILN